MSLTLLDIGGTYIKCADGRQIPISSDGSREVIVQALKSAVSFRPKSEGRSGEISQIGVAIPGPFDYKNGIFLMKHKFASVYGERFQDLVGLTCDIRFMHDVNAVLKGAIRQLGLGHGITALVTMGTGLGYSYAIDGVIQESETGSPAKSIWNLPHQGGILEDTVSARGIRIAYARKTGDGTQSALSIARRAYAGDIEAMEVYHQVGTVLGEALREQFMDMRVETLLLGGQIAKSLSLMIRPLKNALPGVLILQVPENSVFLGLQSLFE
ncbi:MAG: ROK family protein [Bacteroidales bacterium]|nr:ROK family protein [Bacteroidales bacterium]